MTLESGVTLARGVTLDSGLTCVSGVTFESGVTLASGVTLDRAVEAENGVSSPMAASVGFSRVTMRTWPLSLMISGEMDEAWRPRIQDETPRAAQPDDSTRVVNKAPARTVECLLAWLM